MAQAVVVHNYDATESDELTLRIGNLITDIVFNSTGWWEGTLAKECKRGMFPDNFVKLVSDPNGLMSSRQPPSERKCRVLFSYKPAIEDELELQVGDVIDIIAEVEEGWWKGKLRDKIGVFPSNFVEETTNRTETREAAQRKPKAPEKEASPVKEMCQVIFNYEAANPDELSLHEGDVITLITKEGQDPGWWKGEHKGKIGLFPDNFVQVITVPEEPSVSPIAKPDRPSKAIPTSKSKESLSKAMTSSVSGVSAISRKYSDNVRPSSDEKSNLPMLTKKPMLPPPPLKKPQRSSSDLAKSPTAPNLLTKHLDNTSTISYNVKPGSVTTTIRSSNSSSENITVSSTTTKRTIIERGSDSLDGALWSKTGSYTVTADSSSSQTSSSQANNTTSTVITSNADNELDLVSRAAMLTHPTASRVKAPKRRPPSTVYSGGEMINDEEGSDVNPAPPSLTTSVSSTSITTMLNGDAEANGEKSNKVPWVEELKLNQAKKSMQAVNRTRVMIGGADSTTSTVQSVTTSVSSTNISTGGSASPETSKAPTVTGVTLRSHQSSSSTSSATVTPRPQSMVSSLRSALTSPQSNDATMVIPVKQWNELLAKVSRLEIQLESRVGSLTNTINELTSKLEEEQQRRTVMQHEIEKLTDLVTQV